MLKMKAMGNFLTQQVRTLSYIPLPLNIKLIYVREQDVYYLSSCCLLYTSDAADE